MTDRSTRETASHPDCLACRVVAGAVSVPGGVIAENAWWVADHSLGKHGLGAVVVKVRAHRTNLWDLTANEAASLGPFLQQVTYAMKTALEAERIYINSWVDTPPYHVHFVLQPRYLGKTELGLQGLELQIYRALQSKPEETDIVAIATKIRNAYATAFAHSSLTSL
ncbi:MAG: HIT family protein [Leptolyngbyaceae cyanobacterium]